MLTDGIVHDLRELTMSSDKLSCYFSEFTHSSLGHINIKLCQSYCFTVCIGEVMRAKNNYGTWPSTGERLCLFNHDLPPPDHEVQCESEHYSTEFHQLLHLPVAKARGVLIASLLCSLLMATGYNVTICNVTDSHSNNEALLFSSPKLLPYMCNQSALGGECVDVRKYLTEANLVGQSLLIITITHCHDARKRRL